MKAVKSNVVRSMPVGTSVATCDNSGAKVIELISVLGYKGIKRRKPAAGVGDLVRATVKKGRPDMMKQMVYAIIVRQKRPYRRADGTRIRFEDNAVVILKDEKGNPKGTTFKGAIAKEAAERWPGISKVSSIVI